MFLYTKNRTWRIFTAWIQVILFKPINIMARDANADLIHSDEMRMRLHRGWFDAKCFVSHGRKATVWRPPARSLHLRSDWVELFWDGGEMIWKAYDWSPAAPIRLLQRLAWWWIPWRGRPWRRYASDQRIDLWWGRRLSQTPIHP